MAQFSHQAVPFGEMEYLRPDPAVLRTALEKAADALKNAPDYAAARKAFFDLQAAQEEFETMSTLSYRRFLRGGMPVYPRGVGGNDPPEEGLQPGAVAIALARGVRGGVRRADAQTG